MEGVIFFLWMWFFVDCLCFSDSFYIYIYMGNINWIIGLVLLSRIFKNINLGGGYVGKV